MSQQKDLTKISIVTVIGLSIFIYSLFWLKGYKLYNLQKIKVNFQDISGLEEGSIVRWSGLRVGVVEKIKPIIRDTSRQKKSSDEAKNKFILQSENELKKSEELEEKLKLSKDTNEIKKIKKEALLLQDCAQVHLKQAIAHEQQRTKENTNHVEITLVITKPDIPFGPLSTVSIVPTGLVGEQYVEISPNINRQSTVCSFKPVFLTQEPLRFERFLKANVESSEAFREAITKINRLIKDEDVELLVSTVQDVRGVIKSVDKLVDNAAVLLSTTSEKLDLLATSSNALSNSVVQVGENLNKIIGDEEFRKDLKSTTTSLKVITAQTSKLLDEQGLAKDILEIGQTAKDTSKELSSFISDLRQTQQELELPKTISNLNSLSGKLDKLTVDLNSVVGDEKFKENIKVTAKKARETSENLEKISKKYNKRFLLFRLLF